jgi:queuosine precursor transporter
MAQAAFEINKKWLTIFVAVIGFYVAAQLIANIASLRIVMVGDFSIDAGTLIYPLTFTLRDLVHKVAGLAAARAVIIISALVNLVMAGLFAFVATMTPDLAVGPQAEWATVLSPSWTIVMASILAMVVAELIDTEAYRLWVKKFGQKYQYGRVLASNAISVPVDSFIFSFVAFAGILPLEVVVAIMVSNIVVKGLTSIITAPAIYLIRPKQEYTLAGQIK